jgi:hypothetical protein
MKAFYGIIPFTHAAYFPLHRHAALEPFILPTPSVGYVIGLSPQHGNKLALPK